MALETEAWGVDVAVVGSQKSLALPPGLAFLAVSAGCLGANRPKHARRASISTCAASARSRPTGESAFTPAISIIVALGAALDNVDKLGGVDALVENAATLAAMTRAAAAALGMPLLSPTAHGDALTALCPPPGIEPRPS